MARPRTLSCCASEAAGLPPPSEKRAVTGTGPGELRRLGERGRLGRRREIALEADALGVRRALARVRPKHAVQGVDEVFRLRLFRARGDGGGKECKGNGGGAA